MFYWAKWSNRTTIVLHATSTKSKMIFLFFIMNFFSFILVYIKNSSLNELSSFYKYSVKLKNSKSLVKDTFLPSPGGQVFFRHGLFQTVPAGTKKARTLSELHTVCLQHNLSLESSSSGLLSSFSIALQTYNYFRTFDYF